MFQQSKLIIYVKAYFTIVYLLVHDISVNIRTHIYEKKNLLVINLPPIMQKGRN